MCLQSPPAPEARQIYFEILVYTVYGNIPKSFVRQKHFLQDKQ